MFEHKRHKMVKIGDRYRSSRQNDFLVEIISKDDYGFRIKVIQNRDHKDYIPVGSIRTFDLDTFNDWKFEGNFAKAYNFNNLYDILK